jgi:hypothetical protein
MDRKRIALIFGAALVARVVYVVAFMRGYLPNSDADSYFAIARSVSKGHGYAFTLPFEFVHATAVRPPLFPTVLAAAFRVFGTHIGVAQGVNILAGSAAAVVGALIADRIAGPRAGLCSGLILALYPTLIANDVTVLVESLAVLLLFATVLLLVDGRTVLAGVTLGLLMLDRASAQWFVLVLAVWVLWRLGWRHAVRMICVALLVIAPWVTRNAIQVGGPVLVTTNGFNLNATFSAEARQSGGFVDAFLDPRFAEMRVRAIDEVGLDAQLRKKATSDLRADPGWLVHVVRLNFEHWFELRPGLNTYAEGLDGRNLTARDWTLPVFYLVTALGLIGLFRARRAAATQLLLLAAAYFTAVCMFSIAVPRLRSLFDASVALAAGVALASFPKLRMDVSERAPERRPVRVARSVVVVASCAVIGVVGAVLWRSNTQRAARTSELSAVARDGFAIGDIQAQYRLALAQNAPPRIDQKDLDATRDLLSVLGDRAPKVATRFRPQAASALRTVRVAAQEADVVSLLSIAEYLDAARTHRTPSLEHVQHRYEREVQAVNPALEPWSIALSGRSLTASQQAIDRLRASPAVH